MKRSILAVTLALALITYGSAQAGQVVIGTNDLPYAASDKDTITFTDDTTISATNGILLGNTDSVVINGEGKTIRFGNSTGDDDYGIYCSGTGTYDCTISNLRIIREEANDSTGGSGNECIRMSGSHDITFSEVDLIIDGHNAHCVTQTGECYNVLFDRGTWTSNSTSFVSRHDYDGAVGLLGVGGGGSGDYAFKLYGITIADGPAQGVRFKGKAIVDSCDFTLDHQNTYPTGQNANQYAVLFRQMTAGSVVSRTTITSGKDHGGCRGILLEQGEGASDDYILIHDNILDLHCGPDAENGLGILRGIRLRSSSTLISYLKVYDNTVTTTADTAAATTHIGKTTVAIQCNTYTGSSEHIYIYDNTVYARSLDDDAEATAMGFANDIVGGANIECYGNEFYSSNLIVSPRYADGADGCRDLLFYDNTYGFVDTTVATGNDSLFIATPQTWYIGYTAKTSTGNVNINGTYTNGATDDDITFAGTADLTHERVITIYVEGNDDLPVANAACSVWNSYSQLVLVDSTDGDGVVTDTVSYRFESDGADSTAFNDFTVHVWKEADYTAHTDFTVGWTAAGGVDTVTLAATSSACGATHSLSGSDTTTTTVTIVNDYSYDTDSTLGKLRMIWDDDADIANPIDSVEISSGFTDPDTLQATGLTANTQYWFWWVIEQSTCPYDTSSSLSVTTKSEAAVLLARRRRDAID